MTRVLIAMTAVLLVSGCGGTSGVGGRTEGLRIADAALAGGAPEAALSAARGVLAREPANTDALRREVLALAALGRESEAGESLARAAAAAPRDFDLQFTLGRQRARAGDGTGAEAAYRAAVALRPSAARALNGLGVALDLQGRHAEAQVQYQAALAAEPTLASARANMALSLALGGDPRGGLRLAEADATASGAPRRVRHNLAAIYAMAGETGRAETVLRGDMDNDSASGTVHALRALVQ